MMTVAEDLGFKERTWAIFCDRIRKGQCVPVIGGQLRAGVLPIPEEFARRWASQLQYPLARNRELAMIAEFALKEAADEDDLPELYVEFVKSQVDELAEDCLDDGHPFRLLAELPLNVYITTAFDDLMSRALRRFRPNCTPRAISCRWRAEDERAWRDLDEAEPDLEPTASEPVVFHLHGRWEEPASMVLTERDHMAFTWKFARDSQQDPLKLAMLPPPVRRALADGNWFFIGYGAADPNLRALLRALGSQVNNSRPAVAVQLQHDDAVDGREHEADRFLTEYFGRLLLGPVDVVLHDAKTLLTAIRDQVRRPP
jgi:hypothetical protein